MAVERPRQGSWGHAETLGGTFGILAGVSHQLYIVEDVGGLLILADRCQGSASTLLGAVLLAKSMAEPGLPGAIRSGADSHRATHDATTGHGEKCAIRACSSAR